MASLSADDQNLINLLAEAAQLREQKKRKNADDHNLSNLPAEERPSKALRPGRDARQKRSAQVKQEELSKQRVNFGRHVVLEPRPCWHHCGRIYSLTAQFSS